MPADELDAHLDNCASCHKWPSSAATLTRALRVRPVAQVPDLTAAILDAAPPITPPTPRGRLPRVLLCGVAVSQLILGAAQLLGISTSAHSGHTIGADHSHLFNESTAWNLALGLGLLWTALCPAATSGMLPVTAAFVALLIPYSAGDLLSGTTTASRVLSHSLLLIGLVLLAFLHFTQPRRGGGRTPFRDSDTDSAGDTSDHLPDEPASRRFRPTVKRPDANMTFRCTASALP